MIEVNEYASTFGNVLEKNNCFKVFHKLLLGDHIKIGFFTYNLKFNWQEILPIQNIDKQTEQFRNLLLAIRENLSPERKWTTGGRRVLMAIMDLHLSSFWLYYLKQFF